MPLAFTGTGACAYVLADAQPGIISCDYNLQAQSKLGPVLQETVSGTVVDTGLISTSN